MILLHVPQIVRIDLAGVWRVQQLLDAAPTPVLRCLASCISARPFKDISAVTWLAFVLGCNLHGMHSTALFKRSRYVARGTVAARLLRASNLSSDSAAISLDKQVYPHVYINAQSGRSRMQSAVY
jgi:hypothetical protein